MTPLAIDTASCPCLFSVLSLALLLFSLLLRRISPSSFWPSCHSTHSPFSTSPFFNPHSLTCFLVTAQADGSSRQASSISSHMVTRQVAFRSGSLIPVSHA